MTNDLEAQWDSVGREVTIAYVATYGTAGMMIVIGVALIATAFIIAFVGKRPGGYWMVSGIVAFGGVAGLQWYVYKHPFMMLDAPLYVDPLLVAAKLSPSFLYSIGLVRLAWSLRRRDETASDQ